ncbi:MAG: NUDIX hydrolase [Firmicutes bacterium]|nr:NUDIX hydrolase [Bacillota bacterium]
MLFRKCAGGVVFYGEKVFLLQNEKGEWVLPKGVIRGMAPQQEVAVARVKSETGVDAEILEAVGETNYEFYSVTRRAPVCNRVMWYTMRAKSDTVRIAFEQGFIDGGWVPLPEALERITYTQDKSLVRLAHEKYKARLAEGDTI